MDPNEQNKGAEKFIIFAHGVDDPGIVAYKAIVRDIDATQLATVR